MWKRVETLMKERNLKISDVSRGSGVSYSTLTDWKSGRYVPKRDKLEKLADFFSVDVEYIEGKTDRKRDFDAKLEQIGIKRTVPKGTVKPTISELAVLLCEQFYKDHPEYADDNSDDELLSSYDKEELSKAIELYKRYLSSSPDVQGAIETLLKSQQRET